MRILLKWTVCFLLAAVPGAWAEVPEAGGETPAFFLAVASEHVSAEDVVRIKEFVAMNLAVELKDLSVTTDKEDAEAMATQLGDQVPVQAVAVVALVDPTEESASHSIYKYDEHVALINVPTVLEGAEGDAAYFRIERLVMRALAFMTGFEQSPDPYSVMAPYQTLDDLDRRGRNFSPPDTFKFQKTAREKGVPLVEASYFYMAPKE